MAHFFDQECSLYKNNFHLLLFGSGVTNPLPNFFGHIHQVNADADVTKVNEIVVQDPAFKQNIYLFGDLNSSFAVNTRQLLNSYAPRTRVQVIVPDLSDVSATLLPTEQKVHIYQVPISIQDVAVFIPSFFPSHEHHFERIVTEHTFQTLTESNKPGTAHRLGIYLTPVSDLNEHQKHYRLLRCSTNFEGPTETFQATDTAIVDAVNEVASAFFHDKQAPLNHVLAQVYRNFPGDSSKEIKESKAKIKDHSDKTKDMPTNGIMAFCSFYDAHELSRLTEQAHQNGQYTYPDYCYREQSALTKLIFHAKTNNYQNFIVPLCPNSLLLVPLNTNRLFTHEIRPPALNASCMPTRMGYVIRCANTEAIYDRNT
jgi:hypothetical protein